MKSIQQDEVKKVQDLYDNFWEELEKGNLNFNFIEAIDECKRQITDPILVQHLMSFKETVKDLLNM